MGGRGVQLWKSMVAEIGCDLCVVFVVTARIAPHARPSQFLVALGLLWGLHKRALVSFGTGRVVSQAYPQLVSGASSLLGCLTVSLCCWWSPASDAAASMQPPRPQQASQPLLSAAVSGLSALVLLSGSPAFAAASSGGFKLPPISTDPDRCERGYVGNTIGQVGSLLQQRRGQPDSRSPRHGPPVLDRVWRGCISW